MAAGPMAGPRSIGAAAFGIPARRELKFRAWAEISSSLHAYPWAGLALRPSGSLRTMTSVRP